MSAYEYRVNPIASIGRFLYRWATCTDREAEPMGYHWATRHCTEENTF
jgi:hypothetical protein